MTVIDDYIASLSGPKKAVIDHMYSIVRQVAPSATEEVSYAMPAFKYKSKGLVAIMANKNFLSLYPFGSVYNLGVDVSAYECTSGSIHFSVEQPISDSLLRQIIIARMRQIDSAK
jgi:uncharacterized protein YdhG (YjbR/CyaY superfamily)